MYRLEVLTNSGILSPFTTGYKIFKSYFSRYFATH